MVKVSLTFQMYCIGFACFSNIGSAEANITRNILAQVSPASLGTGNKLWESCYISFADFRGSSLCVIQIIDVNKEINSLSKLFVYPKTI